MGTKSIATGPQHEALRNAFIEAVRQTASDMPADQILAVACVFVGQLTAVQDQRRFTSDMIMDLVSENIQSGNQRVIAGLLDAKGGNA
ncbi:hypothetical protein [Mesorhizobium sp. B1-1-7]|uniref:hypothetical protein n=1 Tax=Mesorhizobium sp. B1-1-7 TaxID=2589977 RepID=UPI0011293AEF|nr:hypothetical protein [Mesorhizobium sp. B1-1-7]TPN57155.1 hypothetical protein FJ978_00595 [Mesorhizobium sp. B1-1-7]